MSLTLRQIRYFVATAEIGQISQAAIQLNISQSAVTTAIKELEGILQAIEDMQPKALGMIREKELVFDKSPGHIPTTEADRWQEMAFELYTCLCEANLWCRQAREDA